MPLHKLPQTLYSITLKLSENLVDVACMNIENWYGKFDEEACKCQVKFLQAYLSSNLSSIVLDDLCEQRTFVRNSLQRDNRIKLAVHMHRNMKTFSVDMNSIECKLPIQDPFWVSQLSQLPHLTSLDLHLICTDEILEVVGKCCPLLEHMNMVSRLEQDKRAKDSGVFNALKLKFFVSDEGLAHLTRCKRLKRLTMNKMLRSHYGGRMMTDNGIRKLLQSLTNLQFISYGDTGSVISNGMDGVTSLNLKGLSDVHPSPSHIEAASRLCPKLQLLSLCMPTGNSSQEDGEGRTKDGASVLRALADSTINVWGLELLQFTFDESLLHLLTVKGVYVTSLQLHTCNFISSKELLSIGKSCPNIKSLCIKDMGPEPAKVEPRMFNNHSFESKSPPFSTLQSLQLNGQDWNPEVILPLCLSYAFQLNTMSLSNFTYMKLLDEIMARIIFINPLKELRALYLYGGCPLSFNGVMQVLESCSKLNHITFWEHESLQSEDVTLLKEEVRKNNFDLNICSLGLN